MYLNHSKSLFTMPVYMVYVLSTAVLSQTRSLGYYPSTILKTSLPLHLALNMQYSFFYFYFYTFLRSLVLSRKPLGKGGKVAQVSLLNEIILGFIAGVASRLISTPLNIVTVRLQAGNDHDDSSDSEDDDNVSITDKIKNLKMVTILQDIYKEEGLAGFWRGTQLSAI